MAFPTKEVKVLRDKLNLDLDEFARLIGVTPRSVKRWEAEKKDKKVPGAAGGILSALRHGLERNPDKVIGFIAGAVAIGGLAFLIYKLIDSYLDGGEK